MTPLFGEDSDRLEAVRSTVASVDGDRLKRVGVVTYFTVYLVIAVGGWREFVGLTQQLPRMVRPPALARLHVLLGLPRSVAWGLVSISITVLTLGVLASIDVYRLERDDPTSLADIGDRSWRTRLPSTRGLQNRLPSRARIRERVPEAPRIRGRRPSVAGFRERLPAMSGLPHLGPERGVGTDLRVCDPALAVPATPLSLPRSGHTVRRSPIPVPESHAVAEGFPELADGPVSGADADGSERADGGPGVPIPDVLDPEETLGRATPDEWVGPHDAPEAGGGSDAAPDDATRSLTATSTAAALSNPDGSGDDCGAEEGDGPDADAAWPDDWQAGNEL